MSDVYLSVRNALPMIPIGIYDTIIIYTYILSVPIETYI